MPTMQGNTSVTNATESTNVLAGEEYEFVQGPATVALYATFPAAGTAGDMLSTFFANNVAMVARANVPNVDRYPTVPDDLLTAFQVRGAVRLSLRFRNVSATTRVVRWRVEVG